jgi:hypothetical protein
VSRDEGRRVDTFGVVDAGRAGTDAPSVPVDPSGRERIGAEQDLALALRRTGGQRRVDAAVGSRRGFTEGRTSGM